MKIFAVVRRALLAFSLLLPPCLAAQQGVGVRGSWGWLSPHHTNMWYLVQKHMLAGELFYERRFSGKKDWHHRYREPSWGVGFLATDAGSPDRLGVVMRLMPYFDLPFHGSGRTTLHARFGWGLGYVTRPYHLRDNHRQNAIGSRINAAVLLAFEARHRFGPNTIGAGFALDHQSNASLQVPNLGINLFSFSLSFRHDFGNPAVRDTMFDRVIQAPERRYEEAVLSFASQQVEPYEGENLSVISITAGTIWRTSVRTRQRSGFGFGLDLFNKQSLQWRDPELADNSRISLTQAGIHASYRLFFGHLSVVVDQGFYVYSPIDEKTNAYQRIGMRQIFLKHFLASLTLKTHFGSADHFELGLGYMIR